MVRCREPSGAQRGTGPTRGAASEGVPYRACRGAAVKESRGDRRPEAAAPGLTGWNSRRPSPPCQLDHPARRTMSALLASVPVSGLVSRVLAVTGVMPSA